MNKTAKTVLIAIGFLVLLCGAVFGGYYVATGGETPFGARNTTDPAVTGTTKETEKPKKNKYEAMTEPPYNEYALEYMKIGNLIGNLQNGGCVAATQSMIFQSVPKTGVFKFNQSTEDMSFLSITPETGDVQDYISLNRIDGKMIYIDNTNSGLYVTDSNGGSRVKMASEAKMCFVYDQTIYYTTSRGVSSVNVNGGATTVLYEKLGCEYTLVGLSNTRVYFSVKEGDKYHWLSVGLKKPDKDILHFMDDSEGNAVLAAQYSDGWVYYLKAGSNGNDLYRKHIGVQDETRIAEGVTQYVVDKNCVYFGSVQDGVYRVSELNTNSGALKTVLSVPVGGAGAAMSCYIAGEYVYAVGTDAQGKAVNCRTCLWTAANDLMFYDEASRAWGFSQP